LPGPGSGQSAELGRRKAAGFGTYLAASTTSQLFRNANLGKTRTKFSENPAVAQTDKVESKNPKSDDTVFRTYRLKDTEVQ